MEKFVESLSELLGDTPLSEFSLRIGISLPEIHKYLRCESFPSLRNAIKLADYFTCSLDYLFGLSDEKGVLFLPAPPFSVAFKRALAECAYTRYKLRLKTNLSHQSIDDWYHGRREPSMDNILRVAKQLDCTLDFLVGRE